VPARQKAGERIICLSSQYPEPVSLGETWSGQLQGPLFGLAPDGVFRASWLTPGAVGSYSTFSPLLSSCEHEPGGLFSVALSVRMPRGITSRVYPEAPRLPVTRHRALRCSDFPPPPSCPGESDSPPFQNQSNYSAGELESQVNLSRRNDRQSSESRVNPG
jgi:hypothetical protein